MSDIAFWDEEYGKELDLLDAALTKDGSLETVTECEKKLARIKDIKKSYGLEMRLLKDKSQRAQYDEQFKLHDQKLNELTAQIRIAKDKAIHSSLMKGANNGNGGDPSDRKNMYSTDGKDNDELLEGANKIQDLSFDAVSRIKNKIEESKVVGNATLEILGQQREQIKDIHTEVNALDDKVKRAGKLVFNFARRMATDRLIQMFACLNVFMLAAVIIYVIVSGKTLSSKSTSANESPLAPTPTSQPAFVFQSKLFNAETPSVLETLTSLRSRSRRNVKA